MTCAILGDSIALALSMAHPECQHIAHIGWTPNQIANHVVEGRYDTMIISAGSNNTPGRDMTAELVSIRKQVISPHIVWVLPVNKLNRANVMRVSVAFGDKAVAFHPGPDNVHPRNVGEIWRQVKNYERN